MSMADPSINKLLEVVDSRYTLVVLAAKRARQLLSGDEPKVVAKSSKDVTLLWRRFLKATSFIDAAKAA